MKHKMASVLAFWQSSKSNHLMLSSIETTAGSSRDTLKQSSKVAAIFVVEDCAMRVEKRAQC